MNKVNAEHSRNIDTIRWPIVSQVIIDVCISLHSLDLPPYVLLEIIDWFDFYQFVNQKKKIDLIVNVRKSIEKIKN